MALLSVEDLVVELRTPRGTARPVDGVSFAVEPGRVLGIVGESGCGKSMTALALLRLLPAAARIAGGRITVDGHDVVTLSERALRSLRGGTIGLVFQEPMTALNPVMTVGAQIAEAIRLHMPSSRRVAWARAEALLAEVGIADPERRARQYPHELSGGMRQRVMIAIAIACEPRVLVADEPTTALDVTIQADILDLLRTLRARHGMAIVLITHDLGVVAEQADDVVVMYAGRVVERAPVTTLFAQPRHPYTRALLRAMPRLGDRQGRLETIPGHVPDLIQLPSGCAFAPRCDLATATCRVTPPPRRSVALDHDVACPHV